MDSAAAILPARKSPPTRRAPVNQLQIAQNTANFNSQEQCADPQYQQQRNFQEFQQREELMPNRRRLAEAGADAAQPHR